MLGSQIAGDFNTFQKIAKGSDARAIIEKHVSTKARGRRLTQKAGIKPHGERIRFHCLRKFLIDRISLRMSESKWKQIVGKQISESAYVSSLDLRQAYMNVLDHIQLGILRPPGIRPEEIEMLRKVLKLVKDSKFRMSGIDSEKT